MVRVIIGHGRRGLVVRASPALHLIGSVDLHDLLLVLPDEVAVVPFVESPALVDGDPLQAHLHEGQVGRSDRSAEEGGVDLVEFDPALLQHLAGQASLEDAILGEGRISPTDESVVAIPRALAVAEKYQVVMRVLVDGGKVASAMWAKPNPLLGIPLDGLVVASTPCTRSSGLW